MWLDKACIQQGPTISEQLVSTTARAHPRRLVVCALGHSADGTAECADCCFFTTVVCQACLPIFLSGCKELLVLAGSTFTQRLWVHWLRYSNARW
jgi:hypothetical protein